MSTRAIAPVVGVDQKTISNDLRRSREEVSSPAEGPRSAATPTFDPTPSWDPVGAEAWRTLGYSSWGAMREAEYGGAAFMVPSKSRPEIVARIEAAGISKRETARTAGVDEGTVRNDLRRLSAEYSAPADESSDVVDVEIIEDDEPAHINRETGEVLDVGAGHVALDAGGLEGFGEGVVGDAVRHGVDAFFALEFVGSGEIPWRDPAGDPSRIYMTPVAATRLP